MKLASLLNEDLIFLQTNLDNKGDILTFLLRKSAEKFRFLSRYDEIRGLIENRESLGGTTFPSKLAVPHARIPDFNDMIIAVAVPRRPFEDQGHEVRLVVLLLTSEANPTVYLNTLSSFAKMSMDKGVFGSLVGATHARDFVQIVDRMNFSVRKDILVGDVMSPPKHTGTEDMTLKQATDKLFEHKLAYLPVVNGEGDLVGEVRLLDIIDLGVPPYARGFGGVKFATSLEPFERLLHEEHRLVLGQIMKPPRRTLAPETSLLEASVHFSSLKERQLPVVDGPKLVGVLSAMDILSKVLRS